MGQLRDTIRQMVRNKFASRMVAEAKKDEKVYRHSNYVGAWSELANGSASGQPSSEGSKYDFVRWFMSQYAKAGTPLHLEGEDLAKAESILRPLVGKPDEFIEALNKNRELVFSDSNFRSSPDPVATILDNYSKFKDLRSHLISTRDFDAVKLDDEQEKEKVYDVDPTLTSKADIAKMLSVDPTETTTEMSVGNKVESALKHVGADKVKDILRLYKSNDSSTEEKEEIKANFMKLAKAIKKGIDTYSYKFTETMIDVFDGVTEEDEDAQRHAFAEGVVNFKDAIGVRIGSQELDVFNEVMDQDAGGKPVLDLVIAAAKNPDNADIYFDEILEAAKEVFVDEYNKQGNFNSLGDFIDAMPEVKAVRNTLETIARRGRPAGSTKEVMGARAATAPPAPPPSAEPKRRGRPPKSR
jgi:hypothetical protein